VLPDDQAGRLLDAVMALEDVADLNDLRDRLVPAGASGQ
jgi:hypothetical protein